MAKRILCISADGHVGGPAVDFEPYMEAKYKEQYREFRRARPDPKEDRQRRMAAIAADTLGDYLDTMRKERETFLRTRAGEKNAKLEDVTGLGYEGSVPGLFDPARRLKEQEADGVAAEILFPQGQAFGGFHLQADQTAELDAANARAVNRWGADFISVAPERFAWPVWVPLRNIPAAVEELHAGRKRGLRGMFLTTNPEAHGFLPYTNPMYEPLWATCVELDIPVTLHSIPWRIDPGRGGIFLWRYEMHYRSGCAMRQMIFGGVFQRYPKLKVMYSETFAHGWLIEELEKMDGFYDGTRGHATMRTEDYFLNEHQLQVDRLPRRPSEYFHESFLVQMGAHPEGWRVRHKIGVANLCWGNDYPHVEGTWTTSVPELKAAWKKTRTSAKDIREIMGLNVARYYGFDVEKLQRVADRCGPTLPS